MRTGYLVIAIACSTPASKPERPPPYVPADNDAAPRVTSQADAGTSWSFDWEQHRNNYDKLMATPIGSKRCDWRSDNYPPPGVECLPPDMPRWHSAKVKRVEVSSDRRGARLELDIGTSAKLTSSWWAAAVDERGRPISEWVHPQRVGLHMSWIEIGVDLANARAMKRVALLKHLPEEASPASGPPVRFDWDGIREAQAGSDIPSRAAKVKRVDRRSDTASEFHIDIGARDKLTKDWWGAVVDDKGLAITAWAHPTEVRELDALIVLELPHATAQQYGRVALVKDLPGPKREE